MSDQVANFNVSDTDTCSVPVATSANRVNPMVVMSPSGSTCSMQSGSTCSRQSLSTCSRQSSVSEYSNLKDSDAHIINAVVQAFEKSATKIREPSSVSLLLCCRKCLMVGYDEFIAMAMLSHMQC